jgi:hypothetical protein
VEAFESFVAVALEREGFVVSEAVEFPVQLQTRKAAYQEMQTHGYEVDLVAARADRLVLATVKSFFGSRGVVADHVTGETTTSGAGSSIYSTTARFETKLFPRRRSATATRSGTCSYACMSAASQRRRSAPMKHAYERGQRSNTSAAGPSRFFGLDEVVGKVRAAAAHKQYRDNPVLVTMKVLEAAGLLNRDLPEATPS